MTKDMVESAWDTGQQEIFLHALTPIKRKYTLLLLPYEKKILERW